MARNYNPTIKVHDIQYHRNGISGVPFYSVHFQHDKDHMHASVVPHEGGVAVDNMDKLAERNVKFGENSFRGDMYEKPLREAIRKHQDATMKEHDNG